MNKLLHIHRALAAGLIVAASAAAQAATKPYNPDRLSGAQYDRVVQICQSVLGLSAQEPLQGGDWSGADGLDHFTSHFRGCIVSLSDTLQRQTAPTSGVPSDATPPVAAGAFFYASPRETARRERAACETLATGQSPHELDTCVMQLQQVFYSIDHPVD